MQVIAEVAENDAKAAHVRRPRRKNAADEEAGGGEERHLTDGLVGRDHKRAGDTETTVAAVLAKSNQHLVEQAIEAPVPPTGVGGVGARDGVKVGESAVVVPEPGLVVTEQPVVARKPVDLVSNFPNGE